MNTSDWTKFADGSGFHNPNIVPAGATATFTEVIKVSTTSPSQQIVYQANLHNQPSDTNNGDDASTVTVNVTALPAP